MNDASRMSHNQIFQEKRYSTDAHADSYSYRGSFSRMTYNDRVLMRRIIPGDRKLYGEINRYGDSHPALYREYTFVDKFVLIRIRMKRGRPSDLSISARSLARSADQGVGG